MTGIFGSWWSFVLLGLAMGALSGLFGVGAGIVMVPALALLVGLTQQSAQGMSLMIMVPMALAGAIRYKLSAEVQADLGIATMMAIGGVVGALAGATLAVHLPGPVLRRLFATFLIIVAAYMFITPGHPGPTGKDAIPAAASDDLNATVEQVDTTGRQ